MFKLLCLILVVHLSLQEEIIDTLNALSSKRISIVMKSKPSLTLLKTLANENVFWKFEKSPDTKTSSFNVIMIENHPIPEMVYEKPFSVVLKDKSKSYLDYSKAPFGFYVIKDGKIQKCFVLSNKKRQNYQKCFHLHEANFDFDGFPLQALYSEAVYGDYLIAQSIIEQIAKKFNFTIEYQLAKEQDNWGAVPKLGCNYSTIECFEGIFHNFVTERFDFQINFWYMNPDRRNLIDFIEPFIVEYYEMYINEQLISEGFDWSFYFRPFKTQSWIAIIGTLFIFCILRLVSNVYSASMSKSGSMIVGWLMYVLVFAYYSRAQTMFLSTPTELSIKSLDDVLQSNKWEVAILKGYEGVIYRHLDTGKDYFVEFNKKLNEGYEHHYDTIEDSVQALKEIPGLVMPMSHTLMALYQHTKHKDVPFIVKGRMLKSPNVILLNQGWPLKTLFNKEINKLKEHGQIDSLLHPLRPIRGKHKCKSGAESQFVSINFKEVITAFGLLFVLSISSMVAFLLEMIFHKFY